MYQLTLLYSYQVLVLSASFQLTPCFLQKFCLLQKTLLLILHSKFIDYTILISSKLNDLFVCDLLLYKGIEGVTFYLLKKQVFSMCLKRTEFLITFILATPIQLFDPIVLGSLASCGQCQVYSNSLLMVPEWGQQK